jgi:flavin-dependent dehydrogenase
VRVDTREGRFTGRFLVDASGQSRLLARRHGTATPYECFGNSAVFTHFTGLRDAAVAELAPANDIRIVLRPEGWGWVIPLSGRRLSVGLVSKDRVEREQLSVRERMTRVLDRLQGRDFVPFSDLFVLDEGRAGVVVSLLAVLELIKATVLDLVQAEPYAPIHVRLRAVEG